MYASRQRHGRRRCLAATRVTAGLLLSFLAMSSTPVLAANDGSSQIILQPEYVPVIPPLIPQPPSPSEHVFVSVVVSSGAKSNDKLTSSLLPDPSACLPSWNLSPSEIT